MSAKDLFAPYLNRFVSLLNQKATAKLELSCKDGKVNVNLFHDMGDFVETSPTSVQETPSYKEALKKGANKVSSSQMKRLHKRAVSRAEEARKETKHQQVIAEKARNDLVQAKEETEKALSDAEEAKLEAERVKLATTKLRQEAEKAKMEAEKAEHELNLAENFAEGNMHPDQSSNSTLPLNDMEGDIKEDLDETSSSDTCSWCCIDFEN